MLPPASRSPSPSAVSAQARRSAGSSSGRPPGRAERPDRAGVALARERDALERASRGPRGGRPSSRRPAAERRRCAASSCARACRSAGRRPSACRTRAWRSWGASARSRAMPARRARVPPRATTVPARTSATSTTPGVVTVKASGTLRRDQVGEALRCGDAEPGARALRAPAAALLADRAGTRRGRRCRPRGRRDPGGGSAGAARRRRRAGARQRAGRRPGPPVPPPGAGVTVIVMVPVPSVPGTVGRRRLRLEGPGLRVGVRRARTAAVGGVVAEVPVDLAGDARTVARGRGSPGRAARW